MENVFKEALKIAALLLMSASFIHAGQNDSVDMQTIDYVDDEDDANTSLVEDIAAGEKNGELKLQTDESIAQPVDVILVLDNSGSMKKNDPEFLVGNAIKEFISQASENTRVGIIIFAETADLKVSLSASSYANHEEALNSIKEINYKGQYTDFPAAIERAIYELKETAREDAQKSIIFMTDGIVDTGDAGRDLEKSRWMRQELAADAADNEIKVFGIAFTESADFQLIQSISQQTSGEYFRALTATDLQNVFVEIENIINEAADSLVVLESDEILVSTDIQPDVSQVILDNAEMDNVADTIRPRIEAVEKALYDLEGPALLSSSSLLAILLLFLVMALLFLFLQRKRLLKVDKNDFVQEAYINDPEGKTNKQAHILDERPKMIGRVAGKDTDHMDYIVVNESTISRRHALIEYKDYSFWIIDQGSSNGTFINNEKINNEVRLKHGDKIRLHNYEFDFIVPEMDENDETIVYTPGMKPLVDDDGNKLVSEEITYGLEEIANNPIKSKATQVSNASDISNDEEVTVIHNTSHEGVTDLDLDNDAASLINKDIDEENIDDDDDDDDDDTTVISTINN